MAQSTAFDSQLTSLKTSIQTIVQAIVDSNTSAMTSENALQLQGYSYQDIVDNIMGATAMTVADVALALSAHTTATDNPHSVTKEQVGLSLVENFALAVKADLTTKTALEIDGINNQYTTPKTAYYLAQKALQEISSTAPETLDTINEIATALQGNPDIIQNILDSLGTKASSADLASAISGLTKSSVGLGNVDNYLTASLTDARVATITDRFMTPQTTHAVVEDAVLLLMSDLETEFTTGASQIDPSAP